MAPWFLGMSDFLSAGVCDFAFDFGFVFETFGDLLSLSPEVMFLNLASISSVFNALSMKISCDRRYNTYVFLNFLIKC